MPSSHDRGSTFVPAGGFDWHRTIALRPVFTADYWPGVPAVDKEGRVDISSDLEHLKAYADPVTVRTLAGAFQPVRPAEETENRGWFTMPDLLHITDAEMQQWQQDLHAKLESLLEHYRQAGIQCLDLHTLFNVSGSDTSPDWYHSVPDWEECDLSGRPLSNLNTEWAMACLTHPKLYEVIDRTFQALSFLNDEPAFLGFHVENEPHLGNGRDLSNFGGNPHTRQAFREFLAGTYPSISTFNHIAGTSYPSFDAIEIADPNWLVRTMAARLRSMLVIGVYQTRAAAMAKKHLPSAVTMTRLETGYWLKEYNGQHEINGVELTYLKDSAVDIVSWSHLWNVHDPDGFGQLNVTGGLLRGTGKMIGFTEPHVQRYGQGQWAVFRPEELLNFIYRGLFYSFRMFNLHSWDRQGPWAIYNEPFGAVYSKHPRTLRMVAQLRSELQRSAPYETFGRPVMPPLRLLVSRNARHYPGTGGWYYGNWLSRLCKILERPKLTTYEILEEQTSDVAAALQHCRGVVAIDACLSDRTRKLLDDFIMNGGHLLVIGAPATVGPVYESASLPTSYPVFEQHESLLEMTDQPVPDPVDCKVIATHPAFAGLPSIKLLRPTPLKLKTGAQAVVSTQEGYVVAAANDRVVYLGGFPTELSDQMILLENFERWCGIEPPSLVISQFKHATVVQNWDTSNHRLDGTVIDLTPWTGSVPMSGTHEGQIRELREDCPWLAYHYEDGHMVLESVRVDPKDVKVFRKEMARELPHFENLPETLGFSFWWAGESHPIIGRFTAVRPTNIDAMIVGGPWRDDEIGWYIAEIGVRRIAEGKGRQVRCSLTPGKEYYLTAVLPDHPNQDSCALCKDHAFE